MKSGRGDVGGHEGIPCFLVCFCRPRRRWGTWPRPGLIRFRTKRTRAWTAWLRRPGWKPGWPRWKCTSPTDTPTLPRPWRPPPVPRRSAPPEWMAVRPEVACALTVSERSAAELLADSATLSTGLPRTLSALRSGNILWQHARVMCDETAGLDPAAAAALEGSFPVIPRAGSLATNGVNPIRVHGFRIAARPPWGSPRSRTSSSAEESSCVRCHKGTRRRQVRCRKPLRRLERQGRVARGCVAARSACSASSRSR